MYFEYTQHNLGSLNEWGMKIILNFNLGQNNRIDICISPSYKMLHQDEHEMEMGFALTISLVAYKYSDILRID